MGQGPELAEILRENLHKLYAKVATPAESPLKKAQNLVLDDLGKIRIMIDSIDCRDIGHISGPEYSPNSGPTVRKKMVQCLRIGGELDGKNCTKQKQGIIK